MEISAEKRTEGPAEGHTERCAEGPTDRSAQRTLPQSQIIFRRCLVFH